MRKKTSASESLTLSPAISPQRSAQKRATVADEIAAHKLRRKHDDRPDFKRKERKRDAKPAILIAYDFETTRIAAGTPDPIYLTAYGGARMQLETRIRSMQHLTKVLLTQFLIPELRGAKFVAWNGNRFDAYFIAAALIREPDFKLQPYLTKSKALRGLRVVLRQFDDFGNEVTDRHSPAWEFLDGIAMLGLTGTSLAKFLETFAPEHHKLSGYIDFDGGEEFDPSNAKHRAYAFRDSEGLYHGMQRAQQIMIDAFNQPLTVTMGGACIKIFQAHLPRDVVVKALVPDHVEIVRQFVMRGGFCYCAKRYHGPVWKYDINQAYAAAMRESALPCGEVVQMKGEPIAKLRSYIVKLRATHGTNKVPFYYRTIDDAGRIRSRFDARQISETWITSTEHRQLIAEGWAIQCFEFIGWLDSFSMKEFVDRLERVRTTCEGGPSGAIGTMIKATGNHSFGKTVEKIEPLEFVLAMECPDDCLPYYDRGLFEPIEHVFYRMDPDRREKDYHQPQLGAFITAHARMVLRRAILADPDAWLYADTDCAIFSRDVTHLLDIDPKRYGAWKIEETGRVYRIIAKKVYAEQADTRAMTKDERKKWKISAKGLHTRQLHDDDFARWFDGDAPEQTQDQLNNFLVTLCGAPMYRAQARKGTKVERITA